MKKWKKYIIIFAFLLIVYLFIDSYIFNKNEKNNSNEKKIRITYLLLDYNKTTENDKQSDYNRLEKDDAILFVAQSSEKVKKGKKYYEASIKNVNPTVLENINETVFTLNDVYGNVIDDLKFNKKSNKIYIPKKYFEDKKYSDYKNCPVRMELVSRVKKKNLENLKFEVNTKKFLTHKKVSTQSKDYMQTDFSIFKYRKGLLINKSDIKVYLNEDTVALPSKSYTWYSKAGVISLENISPVYIKKITVKVKKSALIKQLFFGIFSTNEVSAASKDIVGTANISGDDRISNSKFEKEYWKFSKIPYIYGSPVGDKVSSNSTQYVFCGGNLGNYNCLKHDNNKNVTYNMVQVKDIKKDWKAAWKSVAYASSSKDPGETTLPDFLIKISALDGQTKTKTETITVDGKNVDISKTLTVGLTKKWVRYYCAHNGEGANNQSDGFSVKFYIDSVGSKYVTIRIDSDETAGKQNASGLFKLKREKPASITVKKYQFTPTATNASAAAAMPTSALGLSDITFRLYADTKSTTSGVDCSKLIAEDSTDGNGEVTFDGLENGETYCIKEIYKEADSDSSISNKSYMRLNDITSWTTVTPTPTASAEVYKSQTCVASTNGTTCNYYNAAIKYCYKVAKYDLNNGSALFNNGTIKLCSGNICNTNIGNVITFEGLDYSASGITITENDSTPVNSAGEKYFISLYDENGNSISLQNTAATAETLVKTANNLYYWSCPASATQVSAGQFKKYQCLKAKKVDEDTKQPLPGAEFTLTCNGKQVGSAVSDSSGIATLYASPEYDGKSCVITETKAPENHALPAVTTKNVTSIATIDPSYASRYARKSDAEVAADVKTWCSAGTDDYIYEDPSLKINWYKETENGTAASGAEFTANGPKGQLHYDGKTNVMYDANGDGIKESSKLCYNYTSDTTKPTVMVSNSNGEVCVRAVPEGSYTITETKPAQYHTFDGAITRTLTASKDFAVKSDTNKYVNYPTRFEFGKNIVSSYSSTDEGSYKDLTTSELRKLKFNVTDVSGQIVRFKKKRDANNNVIEGEYEYLNNTIDPQGEEEVTDLQLNSDRKIIIWHLPWADSKNSDGAVYSVKEKREDGCTDQNQNTCNGNGFYYPEYNNPSDFQFRIYQKSSPQSINKIESKQSLSNTPTEIKFTKDDIYCKDSNCNSNYQNGTNGTTQDSVFENEEEIKVFDDIQFVLRDSTGRDVTDHLIKVSDNEYRFVKDVNTLSDELKAKLVKTDSSVVGNNLHTKDGTLKITHLCRESTYYIEEYKVPEHTVFILPTTIKFDGTVPANWNWQGHPYVTYKVSDKESTKKTSPYSDTQVIDNTPTRILIYKKDSKYDYLIPDETTTFQLYRCKKGEECHPTDDPDNTENYERVRFWNRALIPGDKEDYKNDKTGLQTEVYKFVSTSDEKSMSESDLKSKTTYDLHPDHGVLVFRYLPANYNYVLVETVAPKNYQLPVGRNAETSFKVVDNTVQVDEKDLPNKPTSVLIKKYADDGKLLKGAEFKIYEVEDSNVCNKNLSPVNQKKKLLKLKTIRDGVYEARPEGDTDTIVTCSDRDDAKCSDIKSFVSKELTTKLTHDKYEDSWSKFEDESTSTAEGRQIELQEGVALIQYLEYDHCYVIEETKAPEGYSLPELKKRYTTITIKKNDEFAHDTNKDLINSPTPFKFYKYDEFNKLIDGAEFKLQKLDDNKKYQDVTVTEIPTENGELFYKVDKDTDNTLIMTKGGTATIYYLTAGQYRVVETKAPGNKVLSKNLNLATFFVDENGSVYGNSIIVNRSIVKTPVKNSASAELIVTIQTGQTVIRYGIVIAVLVGMISGLMILKEKKSRKDYNKDEK